MRTLGLASAAAAGVLALTTAWPSTAWGEVSDTGPAAPGGAELKGTSWLEVRDDERSAFTASGPLVPATAELARRDQPAYYADVAQGTDEGEGCHATRPRTVPIGCTYGATGSPYDVWLVGSSKSGQWADPIVRVAEREGWKVTIHTKSGCAYTPGVDNKNYPECDTFNDAVAGLAAESRPELVMFSPGWHQAVNDYTPADQEAVIDGLLSSGVGHVAVLWDSPAPTNAAVGCIESGPASYLDCTYGYTDGGTQDLNEAAAQRAAEDERVSYVDLRPWVCPGDGRCPSVVGGVQVSGKGSHVTASYARTLVNPIHAALTQDGVARIRVDRLPTRISGVDRYATAAMAAWTAPAGAGATVYLATGDNWPDAVSAAALGTTPGAEPDARVLLTRRSSLPGPTSAFLREHGVGEVVIVGQTDVVSSAVEDEVRSLGLPVRRVGGETRYDTTALLAGTIESVPATVRLATGTNWPDATVAAAAGPTLLTRPSHLPTSTRDLLSSWASAGLTEVVVVGDREVVADGVVDEVRKLGLSVDRAAGANRYATSIDLASGQPGASSSTVFVTGTAWPDAVAASQLGSTVLLTQPHRLPTVVAEGLADLAALRTPRVVGGYEAVERTVESRILDYTGP